MDEWLAVHTNMGLSRGLTNIQVTHTVFRSRGVLYYYCNHFNTVPLVGRLRSLSSAIGMVLIATVVRSHFACVKGIGPSLWHFSFYISWLSKIISWYLVFQPHCATMFSTQRSCANLCKVSHEFLWLLPLNWPLTPIVAWLLEHFSIFWQIMSRNLPMISVAALEINLSGHRSDGSRPLRRSPMFHSSLIFFKFKRDFIFNRTASSSRVAVQTLKHRLIRCIVEWSSSVQKYVSVDEGSTVPDILRVTALLVYIILLNAVISIGTYSFDQRVLVLPILSINETTAFLQLIATSYRSSLTIRYGTNTI